MDHPNPWNFSTEKLCNGYITELIKIGFYLIARSLNELSATIRLIVADNVKR